MLAELSALEGIQRILSDGRRTGTNKFGLLLAIIDLAPLVDTQTRSLSAHRVAEKVLEIHWDQAKPFHGQVLRQVSSGNRKNSTVVQQVLSLQEVSGSSRWLTYAHAEAIVDPLAWTAVVRKVQKDTWRNPVAKLQSLGTEAQDPFLYTYDSSGIELTPTALEVLVGYGPVLRGLIEAQFVQAVRRMNRQLFGSELDLSSHLFGVERDMPGPTIRNQLLQLQSGKCIYTGDQLRELPSDAFRRPRAIRLALDHAVPWARHRVSALENFVVTSQKVNAVKRDSLLGQSPLARWLEYLELNSSGFRQVSVAHDWPSDIHRVLLAMRAVTARSPLGTNVWDGESTIPLTQDLRTRCMALLDGVLVEPAVL